MVLKENRRRTTGELLSGGVAAAGESLANSYGKYQENSDYLKRLQENSDYLKRLTGSEQDIPEQFQEQTLKGHQEKELERLKHSQKLQSESGKRDQENVDKIAPFQSALDTIGEMRRLRGSGKLGIGSTYSPFSKTRETAGKYSQLGKSLIQMASTIPIRNQAEFNTLAHDLYDPNITDATANGILDAMEQIITQGMQQYVGGTQQQQPQQQNQERPPLSQFER